MPIRHDAGALSEYTLETTTGIDKVPSMGIEPGYEFGNKIDSQVITWGPLNYTFAVSSDGALIATDGAQWAYHKLLSFTGSSYSRFSASSEKLLITTSKTSGTSYIWVYENNSPSDIAGVNIAAQLGASLDIQDTVYFGNRYLLLSSDLFDGHFGRVYYSDIEDPETYDPLGFIKSLDQSTANRGMAVVNSRLYVFSGSGYSVWTVSPDVNLPFSQQTGSKGNIGLLSARSKCVFGDSIYFFGQNGTALGLYAISGGGLVKISSPAVDDLILSFIDEPEVSVFSFTDNGQVLIAFSISANDTVCLDIGTGEFHKRSTFGGKWDVIGTGSTLFDAGQVVVGSTLVEVFDVVSLNIGLSDDSIGTEFGNQVAREMVTSPFNSDGVTNNVRELAFQTDIDYSSLAPVTLPDLSLSVSENFGKTFEAERLEAFDEDGENTKILRYMNIGFFRQAFVFKLKTDTIYPHKILKMMTRLEKGFRQI